MDKFSEKEWEICLNVLQKVSENTDIVDNEDRFKALVAKIHKNGKQRKKLAERQVKRNEDQAAISKTGRVLLEEYNLHSEVDYTSSQKGKLNKPKNCYVCKSSFSILDSFYHLLCPKCALLNHQKRNQRTDLSGRIAIVTGGRIKIGYELVLKLLRDGAEVLASTRFPVDALERISKEPDFPAFKDRIQYIGLDLRHLPSVEEFSNHICTKYNHIDILVNNAAQTIRRPANFYADLYQKEQDAEKLEKQQQKQVANLKTNSNINTQLEWVDEIYFPKGELDRFDQPVDKRPDNSWVATLSEVSSIEFIEAQVINYFSPYILVSRLKPMLERSIHDEKFIVNVSAMEGQFARKTKTAFHPHTNMAKAALNMMTRTSAKEYALSGIYMNSVDTGWITQENPFPKAQRVFENGFVPPLDEIDGAARIYDPIVRGINGELIFGHFLKDYEPHAW